MAQGKKAKGRARSASKSSPRKPAPRRPVGGRPAGIPRRAQRERRALYIRLVAAAAVLLIAGVVVYTAVNPSNKGPSVVDRLELSPAGCKYDTKFDGDARAQSQHIQNPTYKVDPPAGGAHFPRAAEPGFYTGDNAPSDGQLVHAMEHGFTVLWFRPDVSDDDRERLSELSDTFGRELIVVPRESLLGEIAVTGWHRRLLCDELDTEAVALFTSSFKDKGPEKGFL